MKVLFICGSLRKQSFNRQLGELARGYLLDLAEKNNNHELEVSWLDYTDIPFMNQDIEFPAPKAVKKVREEVMAADALWFFSPEYNKCMTGPLKNLIDWLSRPIEKGNPQTAIRGKLVTQSGAGGMSAANHSADMLYSLLEFVGAKQIKTMHTQVSITGEAFATNVFTPTQLELDALKLQARLLYDELNI